MMINFIKWVWDRLWKHMYWYDEKKVWKGAELWGSSIQLPNTPMVVKTFGHKVTKKICRYCNTIVWTNNPESICGRLGCWIRKGEKHAVRAIR